MSKLGFKFAAVPRDRHPEWFEVSLEARCLGLELFVTTYDDKTRIAEVAVTEKWAVSLCKLLRVEVEDRRAACRMLEALERRGLLVVEHGKARVVFRADEPLGPQKPDPRKVNETSEEGQCDVNATSEWGQSGVNRSPTIGNDTTPVSQREETEEIRRERETRARDELSRFPEDSIETDKRRGSDFMLQATCRSWLKYDDDLVLIGARPEPERLRALAAIRADPWCQANMKKVSPAHVLRKWNDYSSGTTLMQLAKVETSDSQKWRSRVQQSTKKLEELRERRSQLRPLSPNYASELYDLDKAIREESEALERRKRELHALTG